MTEPVVIGTSPSIKFVKDANSKVICLNRYMSTGTGVRTFHDIMTQANYTPGVGKKFVMLKYFFNYKNSLNPGGSDIGIDMYFGTGTDTTVGGTQFLQEYSGSSTDNWQSNSDCYFELAAGDYLTGELNGANALFSGQIIGVEVDV
jgi:hypothetical protein